MASCNNKVMAIRNAFKKAVKSTGKAFMLDADNVLEARLYRMEPNVFYCREFDNIDDDEGKVIAAKLSIKLHNDRDVFDLTFDGARELVKQLTEMLDELDEMENKYLAALEKISKDKVEASKEATETFKF